MDEIEQGIYVPPLDLVFPILRLRHAIHVVFGSSDLQPLRAGKLSRIEEIMSGKFNFPSAKEAKALLEGAASASQKKEAKRKRTFPDTRVVDDYPSTKSSTTEASGAPFATPADPSPTKSSRKTKLKSTESEGMLTVSLPSDGSAYSDPSFVKEVTKVLLLPTDRKRLTDIGPI